MVNFNSEEPVFFMSRNNKTRQTKWHETCNCKCRLNASVCIINKGGMTINAGVNVKN